MRKVLLSLGLGLVVMSSALILMMGSGGVEAQTGPTATVNIPGIPRRTPQVTPAETPPAGETPEAITPEAAETLPLLWMTLDTGFEPVYINGVAAGGPVDTYTFIGDPCVQNVFSAQLPTFELHMGTDSQHIRIGFQADDGRATAIMMWDPIGEQWWCNTQAAYSSEVEFEPLIAGDYPFYVAVQGTQEIITGTLYITEERIE